MGFVWVRGTGRVRGGARRGGAGAGGMGSWETRGAAGNAVRWWCGVVGVDGRGGGVGGGGDVAPDG